MEPALRDFLAGEERAFAADPEAFGRVGLRSRRRAHADPPETVTKILGRTWAAPLAVAPPDVRSPANPGADLATVRGTADAAPGVPVVVSPFAGPFPDEPAPGGGAPLWLRTYRFRDRSLARRLVERAARAGFEALILTTGLPRTGAVDAGPPGLPGLPEAPGSPEVVEGPPGEPVDWSMIGWLRSAAALPVLAGGVRTVPDALRAIAAGADGIVVSGGTGGPAALEALPGIAAAVAGRCPVLLDGGIQGGADVLVALASGADAAFLGRPVLDGLTVDGRAGVADVLGQVIGELRDAMAFTGTASITGVADAGPALLRTQPPPLQPPPAEARSLQSPSAQALSTGAHPPGPARMPRTSRTDSEASPSLAKEDLHSSLSSPLLDTMNFLNEITSRYPDAISFAPGRPYDGFFDNEQVFDHIRRFLDHLAEQGRTPDDVRTALFQYGPTAGQIREVIADSLREDEDIDVPPESIVVTVGAQEGMLLVLRALTGGPDDVIMVSSPCYMGIPGAARLLDVPVTAVEETAAGVSCAGVEAAIQAERARGRRPRAFYVIPDHANPSGITMTLDTRHALLDLAARHDLLILEDSPYRLVSPGTRLPTLKALDRGRRVVHIGSYSKTIFPGARVGFVVADQRVTDADGRTSLLADELAKVKSMVTVNTSSLSQAAVAGAILAARGRLSEANTGAAEYYGRTMRSTLESLERALPPGRRAALGVRWNEPGGGFFLKVEVPFEADHGALRRSAREFGVIWTPMTYFHPGGGGRKAIRLSTSYLTSAEIEEGTARLARFIESESAGR
ncbi:aminotransferase class I/II-fold pyridoxal phosphate-dependent enzyme [Actinomadura viridis]|uniref:(S)-3,5-dihydroxyphenylglycine transaminase n=1 Tax=Actinomadura viridis TaxID=58110 RepID=A0A931DU97_9ACTN|nr:aminotransferase class I/II-fold pyridoxal phosphate-dependent enzyme [Actinomadura viridis]MBG6094006.1 (S)-3,5-dihydroxyphenylglycine transaminase [Actinomadura viridis]